MKHFAIASMSIRRANFPYTCPGLGDRVHSVLLGYQYGRRHGYPVTVHITSDKNDKPRKNQSWPEIVSLFPEGTVEVMTHPVKGLPEKDWRAYLKGKGYDTEAYCYRDTLSMNKLDERVPLDISEYLKDYPCLDGPVGPRFSGGPYITTQWDSSGKGMGRKLAEDRKERVLQSYREDGYEVIAVGGEAKSERLRDSVPAIARYMAGASLHVGVDSGMMHLASLFLKPEQIHIYTNKFISHHTVRAEKNGCILNYYEH